MNKIAYCQKINYNYILIDENRLNNVIQELVYNSIEVYTLFKLKTQHLKTIERKY